METKSITDLRTKCMHQENQIERMKELLHLWLSLQLPEEHHEPINSERLWSDTVWEVMPDDMKD